MDNNLIIVNLLVNPTSSKPFSLKLEFKGDPKFKERLINVSKEKFYYVYRKNEDLLFGLFIKHGFGKGTKLLCDLEKLFENNESIDFKTKKSAIKAKEQIQYDLDAFAEKEWNEYRRLLNIK
ncbi:hypothetical protein SAMN04487943_10640 [Gracilibacillus orientalis]|uniref:Uncharacterized protein n=1 Tax=Gracilibacillus orientalis TaxID=334253 RepID=A0A1I4M6H5_9BACI|nr:hypothetical protein [Gracilibacillus orientalis]SFL98577.1 hypothetical protein SAMN04487943_10640 [Gracilibacillus orientalis]